MDTGYWILDNCTFHSHHSLLANPFPRRGHACAEYPRNLLRFRYQACKLRLFHIARFTNQFEPYPRLGQLFHGHLQLVHEILARLRLASLGIVCRNARRRAKQLISEIRTSDILHRQRCAHLDAPRRKCDNSVFKIIHLLSYTGYWLLDIGYLHIFTFPSPPYAERRRTS